MDDVSLFFFVGAGVKCFMGIIDQKLANETFTSVAIWIGSIDTGKLCD